MLRIGESQGLALIVSIALLAHCGGVTVGQIGISDRTDAAMSGGKKSDASATSSAGGATSTRNDGSTQGSVTRLFPCNDGTGKTDCCPPDAPYGECVPGTGCRTPCSHGGFGSYTCGSNGTWIAYLGIYPCSLDEGADSGAAAAPVSCADGGTIAIHSGSYDSSCVLDSDCVAVGEGNACSACPFSCPTAAINRSAKSAYDADVARTPAGQTTGTPFCGCPMSFGPCCINNYCRAGLDCMRPSP